ncbi:MAG: class I SAM-dependent methyltransferase [Polyangiaceae bacterium]|nr:class I SAM-dependent methyltransferase [Polyangiaceae bacterium]
MRTSPLAAALVLVACGPQPEPAPPPAPAASPPATASTEAPAAEPAAPAPTPQEVERQKAEAAAQQKLAQLEVEAQAERARWTPELRAGVTRLAETRWASAQEGLAAALRSEHRLPGHAERDAHRHPVETMAFLGLRPDSVVMEVGGGDGWYTELLAPLLAKRGKLVVTALDPSGPEMAPGTYYGRRFQHYIAKSTELSGKVEVVIVDPKDLRLGHEGQIDLAFAFREMHNWHRRGRRVQHNLAQVFAALKPGGTFGVVQHRAPESASPDESAERGYLPEAWVIEQAKAVGFRFVGKSEVNANPKDTKDHPDGVWSLPPVLRSGDQDRERFMAIGESDRMTLRFEKPKLAGKE